MGVHNLGAAPVHSSYPPIAASKVAHIQGQLAKHKDWNGLHDVTVKLFGKFTYQARLSHRGVIKLRAQKLVIVYDRQLTMKDNIGARYSKGLGFNL